MTELEMENAVSSIYFSSVDASDAHRPDWWADERTKNTWNDVYTARKRVFLDGQCEVTVCKERFFVGPAMTPETRSRRGESEKRQSNDDDAGRRAKKQVRLCCKTIGADRMVTLTYRKNMTDRFQALKDFDAFRRRLGKVADFHYVAVIEEQERGALHFHVAVRGRQNYVLLRSVWQRVLGVGPDGEQMGQVNVRDPHKFGFGNKGAHKIASYIAKYCGKEMQCRDLNQKRYFRSRGVVVPEVIFWRLQCTDMLSAVNAAVAALSGHALAGMQSWCNNGLGVVYLATAPGWRDPVEDCPF
jgi:hypothetical protein